MIGGKADYFTRIGRACGYPQCCVDHFASEACAGRSPAQAILLLRGEGQQWQGTGFVPCPKCAKEVDMVGMDAFARMRIAPNRDKRFPPFPETDDDLMVAIGLGTDREVPA